MGAVALVGALAVGGGVVYATSHVAAADGQDTRGPGGPWRNGPGRNGPLPGGQFPGGQGPGGQNQGGQGPGGGMAGPQQGAAGPAGALYGEYVVRSGKGYAVMLTQTGTVTASASTSLTVRSADGHTVSYAVDATTTVDNGAAKFSAVKVKDTVSVLATKSGRKLTAVTDGALLGSSGGGARPPGSTTTR